MSLLQNAFLLWFKMDVLDLIGIGVEMRINFIPVLKSEITDLAKQFDLHSFIDYNMLLHLDPGERFSIVFLF